MMFRVFKVLVGLLGMLVLCSAVQAQNITTKGRRFWLAFMESGGSNQQVALSVVISSATPTTGTVAIPGQGWSQNFTIGASGTVRVNVPVGQGMVTGSGVAFQGVRVTAADSVNVYATNYQPRSHDASIILPVGALRDSYIVTAYSQVQYDDDGFPTGGTSTSELAIVATENNTQVKITPNVANNYGIPPGSTEIITLDEGQVFQLQSNDDLTGTRITTGDCKPVAVFGGNVCTNVGACTRCDHLYEQIFPTITWGQNYIAVPFRSRFVNGALLGEPGDLIRVLASENNTQVSVNGSVVATLNAGQFIDRNLSQASTITANRPVSVAQYSKGGRCDQPILIDNQGELVVYGDPFMLMLSPVDQMIIKRAVVVASNVSTIDSNFVNIVARTNAVGTVRVDGVSIQNQFAPVPANPQFSFARVKFNQPGNHTIQSDSGCLAYLYGFGSRDSYGYAGDAVLNNLAVRIVAPERACANAPVAFSVVSNQPISSYLWRFGDGTTSTSAAPTKTYTSPGVYGIKLIVQRTGTACLLDSTTWSIEIARPTFTFTSTNISCAGAANGTIIVSAQGGFAPLQYRLNNGPFQTTNTFSGLAAGTYTVSVRDNLNCTAQTQTVTLSQPAPLSGNLVVTPITCFAANDGKVELVNLTGGTPPYSFSLGFVPQPGPVADNLGPQQNTQFIIRDANGCELSLPFTLVQPPLLTLQVASVVNNICKFGSSGSITVAGSGGTPPLVYRLLRGQDTLATQPTTVFPNLSAGAYTIRVTDSKGCAQQVQATVTEPLTALSLTVTSITPTTCTGKNTGKATVQGAGGQPPYTYSRDSLTFGPANTFEQLFDGLQKLYVRDALGCVKSVSFTVPAFIELNVVLNAAQSNLALVCPGDANGRIVYTGTGGQPPYQFSIDSFATLQPTGFYDNLPAGTYTVRFIDADGCNARQAVVVAQPDTFRVVATVHPVVCFGQTNGFIRLDTLSGGTPPYSWSFQGQAFTSADSLFDNLATGTYSLTVRDTRNCSRTFTYNVIEPPVLTLAGAQNRPVSCFGDSTGLLEVVATGGIPPYRYRIEPLPYQTSAVFDSLPAGTYTLTVQDSVGCTATLIQTLDQPLAPLVVKSVTKKDYTCYFSRDGKITIHATGGTKPYTYSTDGQNFVSDSAFTVLSGRKPIIVQDARGCIATADSVDIFNQDSLAFVPRVVNISCTGLSDGRVSTTASGGVGGYTYSLNGSVFRTDSVFTGLAPGVYNLFVRDANGCVKSRIFRVVEPAPFVLTFFKVESAKCFGSADGIIEIRVEGGRLPYTYTWSHDPTLNAPIAEGLKAGVYTVSAVDSSGCSIASRTYTVPQPEQVQAGEDYAVCRLGAVPLGVFMLREGKPAGGFWRGPAVIDSSLGLVDSDRLPEFARLQYEYIVKNCRDTLQLDVTGAIIPIRTDTVCLNETRYKLPEARPDTGFWYYGPVFRNFTGFADLTDLTIGRNQLYYFNNGCLDTLQLYVVPPPVARIGTPPGQPDTLRFPAASFTFLNQTDTLETLDWFWRLASGDTTTRLNPTVRYEFGGVYRNWLVVRNRFGCSDSALKVVVVIDTTEIELPTAFTPNGDNRNDFWEVKGLDFKHHTVAFYSRWAGKIYSYTAQGNYSRWDGVTPDGTPIPEGTYGVTFDGFKTDGRRIYRAILVHVLR